LRVLAPNFTPTKPKARRLGRGKHTVNTMNSNLFVQIYKLNYKIAMIAIKHKTFELDKPGWTAALMYAYKRKKRKIY